MAILNNWFIDDTNYLHGNVAGHPKLPNGMFVDTTRVQNFVLKDTCIEAQTRNTLYILPFEKCSNDYTENTFEQIKKVFGEDTVTKIQKCMSVYKCKRAEDMKAIGEQLQNNEYLLDISVNSNYYFDGGLYKDSAGNLHEIVESVHIGTFQDSVILSTHTEDDWDGMRYFPYAGNRLEFYEQLWKNEDRAQVQGYIRNTGSEPIEVMFIWGKGVKIEPGSKIEVVEGMGDFENTLEFSEAGELYPAVVINTSIDTE